MRHDFDMVESSYYKTDKGRTDRQLLCSYNFDNTLAVQFTYQLSCRRNIVLPDLLAFAIDFWMLPRYIPEHFGIFSEV